MDNDERQPSTLAAPPADEHDKPRMGRTPIGSRSNIFMDPTTKRGIALLAEPFGQRRRGAIVRLAIRRMLAHPHLDLAELLAERRSTPDPAMVVAAIHLGDDLAVQLTTFATPYRSSRAELVRLACDLLLADIASNRLHGRPIDLTREVNAEVYRGEANRDTLIRRRQRALSG